MKLNKILLMAVVVFLVTMPVLVLAQGLPTPTPPLTGSGVNLAEIEALIRRIAQFLIVISLIVAVIFIVIGGIRYMMAQGDEGAVKAAKSTIWNGAMGALVVLAVGVILQTLAGLVTRSFFG